MCLFNVPEGQICCSKRRQQYNKNKLAYFFSQDNSSENKEENLTNACFDQATYHIRGEEVQIETPFLITTNLESRSERAGDREDLILFEVSTASPQEISEAEKKVIIIQISLT